MTEEIIRMAREAGVIAPTATLDQSRTHDRDIERFAALVAAAEREKVARWMADHEYATGHGDTIEDLLKELEWQIRESERERCDQLLEHIRGWVEAYPLSVFPEPDFGKAHKVLTENGMTLDAIGASNMRHVITQVKEMVDAAIRARGQE
jgi:hypothetical protein